MLKVTDFGIAHAVSSLTIIRWKRIITIRVQFTIFNLSKARGGYTDEKIGYLIL